MHVEYSRMRVVYVLGLNISKSKGVIVTYLCYGLMFIDLVIVNPCTID